MELQVYKKASQIVFDVCDSETEINTVADVGRGDTFLYRGGVHMRIEVSAHRAIKDIPQISVQDFIQDQLRSAVFIINLQTGRAYVADLAEQIHFVKVRMTVDGKGSEK